MKQLSKSLVLALMVPVLLMPNMTKATTPIPQLRFNSSIVLPDYGSVIPNLQLSQESTSDNDSLVESAKNNYTVTFSPSVSDGIYQFNHSDKKVMAIVVDEKVAATSTIKSVQAKIKNSDGETVETHNFANSYGQFSKILDLTTLSLNGTYNVNLTINSQVETSTSPISFDETTNVLTLIGSSVDTSNIDNTDNEDENENNIDEDVLTATDNYHINVSPLASNGVYEFNHSNRSFSTITVSEADYSSKLEIKKVKINVRDENNVLAISKVSETPSSSGFFIFNLDLSALNLEKTYTATATITYRHADTYVYSSKTYSVVKYQGEESDDITNEEVDNYRVSINKETVTASGKKTYYYKTTDSNLQVLITEDDKSSSAINEIVRVKYYIRNIDEDNELVYNTVINSANSLGYYTLNFALSTLNGTDRYQVEAYITYLDTDDSDHYYTKLYDVIRLVPKSSSNDSNTPANADNATYNINKSLVTYEGTNLYLYNKSELTNINTYQSSYGTNAPKVESVTYLLDGSSIKNCESSSCNLQYELPLNDEVGLSVRVNYEYFDNYENRYHRYSKIYDLGRHLRVSTENNNTGSNSSILTLNDFVLVKGTTPSVYLVNKFNNRFYIPDWSVLKSWYYQPNIVQVNDTQLAQYTLKDNMIYRPGSLIKIATDPKCYAVDLNGKLRWVYNETVARAIYGANWNKNIYIVPDALFPSYSFGANIYSASDYTMPSLSDALQMYNK